MKQVMVKGEKIQLVKAILVVYICNSKNNMRWG